MATLTTNAAMPRLFSPFTFVRSMKDSLHEYRMARRRARELRQMYRTLNGLNDRQLAALGLTRHCLDLELEARYDASLNFVEDILAIVDGNRLPGKDADPVLEAKVPDPELAA